MEVQSLVDLASKKVAACIVNKNIQNVDYQLINPLSSQIFEEICRLTILELDVEMIQIISNKLNLTNVSLMNYYLDEGIISMLSHQCLESLQLGFLAYPNKYIERNTAQLKNLRVQDVKHKTIDHKNRINIISMLNDILNPTSKKQLAYLNLNSEVCETNKLFLNNWIQPLSQMLPALQTLKISHRTLSPSDFQNLCSNFPNLYNLDINGTRIGSLNGISKLQNLEVLSIGNLQFEESADMLDLFNLKNLKVLSLSCEGSCDCCPKNLTMQFAGCNKRLPELTCLDCSFTQTDDQALNQIVEMHPKLEKILVIGKRLPTTAIIGVEILTSTNLKYLVSAFKHYISTKNHTMVLEMFSCIHDFILENPNELNESDFNDCARAVFHMIKSFKTAIYIHGGIDCLLVCLLERYHLLGHTEILNSIHYLLATCTFYLKFGRIRMQGSSFRLGIIFQVLSDKRLLQTPGLDINRIFCKAMKVIILTEGEQQWKLKCLELLSTSLDKIDLTKEIYQQVKMEMLARVLRNMHRSRRLAQKFKRMARSVLRFIQLVM